MYAPGMLLAFVVAAFLWWISDKLLGPSQRAYSNAAYAPRYEATGRPAKTSLLGTPRSAPRGLLAIWRPRSPVWANVVSLACLQRWPPLRLWNLPSRWPPFGDRLKWHSHLRERLQVLRVDAVLGTPSADPGRPEPCDWTCRPTCRLSRSWATTRGLMRRACKRFVGLGHRPGQPGFLQTPAQIPGSPSLAEVLSMVAMLALSCLRPPSGIAAAPALAEAPGRPVQTQNGGP